MKLSSKFFSVTKKRKKEIVVRIYTRDSSFDFECNTDLQLPEMALGWSSFKFSLSNLK